MAIMGQIFFAAILLIPGSAWALKDYKRAMPKKMNSYLSEGVVIGGIAGRGFSLIDINRKMGKTTLMERVVLDIGDELGAPVMGVPGYFHVEVDDRQKKIIVELAQVQRSIIPEKQMIKKMAGSPYLAFESVSYDPEDKSTSMVFKMKQPIKIEIFSPQKMTSPGRIIFDLLPIKKAKK